MFSRMITLQHVAVQPRETIKDYSHKENICASLSKNVKGHICNKNGYIKGV